MSEFEHDNPVRDQREPGLARLACAMDRLAETRERRVAPLRGGGAGAGLAALLVGAVCMSGYGAVRLIQDFTVPVPVVDHDGRQVGQIEAEVRMRPDGSVAPVELDVMTDAGPVRHTIVIEGQGHTDDDARSMLDGYEVGLAHPADFVAPAGVFTRADIAEYLACWERRLPHTDIAEPEGTWDRADILEYLDRFAEGRRAALAERGADDDRDPHWPTLDSSEPLR